MKNIYKISISLLALILFTYACEHEQGAGPQGGGLQPTFSSIQDNIFTPKCVNAGCHPGGGAPASLPLQAGVAYDALVNIQSVFSIPCSASSGAGHFSFGQLRTISTAILRIHTWGYSRRNKGESGLRRSNVGCWG